MAEFPIDVVRKIHVFLTPKEAGQTCLVSKTWFHAWSTRQILHFNIENPNEEFLNYINNTLSRYIEQKTSVLNLGLSITLSDPCLDSFIHTCVSKAVGTGVQEVYLCLKPGSASPYILPQTVFLAETLNVLFLSECKLVHYLIYGALKCPNLRKLILDKVHLDEDMLKKLISICSNLNTFYLCECEGIQKIKISDLPNLERFEVCTLLYQEVVIDQLSNLVSFCYKNDFSENPWFLNSKNVQFLKHMCLEAANLTDSILHNLLSELKFIVDLRLHNCNELKKIIFASRSLEKFSLLLCKNVVEVTLNAPNLDILEYCGSALVIPTLFVRSFRHREPCIINVNLLIKPCDYWFWNTKLKDFRMKRKLEIKNLSVYLEGSSSTFVNTLKRIFSPNHLTVYQYCTNGTFMEYLRESLLTRRKQKDRTDAEIECSSDMQKKWQLFNKKAMEDGKLRLSAN